MIFVVLDCKSKDLLSDEVVESFLVLIWRNCRNRALLVRFGVEFALNLFEDIFCFLLEVPVLEVVDDAEMIHVITIFKLFDLVHEGMSRICTRWPVLFVHKGPGCGSRAKLRQREFASFFSGDFLNNEQERVVH